MSIFQATPAPNYTTTTTETPRWMQDAIYSQIQSAQNIANRPYEAYQGQTVAGLSPYQQAAYQQVASNQGMWQPALSAAAQGMQDQATGMWGSQTAAPYLNQAAFINQQEAAAPYLQQATGMSGVGAATPYLQQATGMNAAGAATPYFQQAINSGGLAAAQPYLNRADDAAYQNVGSYMNPYQQNVMDVIAKQGARNLTENLLPGVSDAFVKAGGFGGTRMGEFGSRAVRDTQESILDQQSQLANQGYSQAMNAAQTDLGRQLSVGQTAGNLAGQQQSTLANIGSQLGGMTQAQQQLLANVGGQMGNLTQAQQQLLANVGQTSGQLAGQQQSALAGIGGQFGSLANQDLIRQQSALGSLAQFGQLGQQMASADTAALEAAGQAQQNQQQSELNAAQNQWNQQQNYPMEMMNWLSSQVRGLAPVTPQTQTTQGTTSSGVSPLSQIASALAAGAGVYNAFNR